MDLFGVFTGIIALFTAPIYGWAFMMINPPHNDFRRARICFCLSAAIWWTGWIWWGTMAEQSFWVRTAIVSVLAIIGSIALMESLRVVTNREDAAKKEQMSKIERQPLTMYDIFNSDFIGLCRITSRERIVSSNGIDEEFVISEYIDINTNSFFISVFFRKPDNYVNIMSYMASNMPRVIDSLAHVSFEITTPGSTSVVSSKNLRFSNKIYAYLDNDIDLQNLAAIDNLYRTHGYSIDIRMSAYRTLHWKEFERTIKSVDNSIGPLIVLPDPKPGMTILIKNESMPTGN